MAAWSLATLGSAEGADLLKSNLRTPLCEVSADRRGMFDQDYVDGLLENLSGVPCEST
jgi:hypothetical protein